MFKKKFYIVFDLNVYSQVYSKLGVIVGINVLHILILVWMTMTFIQGHSYMRKLKVLLSFLANFRMTLTFIQGHIYVRKLKVLLSFLAYCSIDLGEMYYAAIHGLLAC